MLPIPFSMDPDPMPPVFWCRWHGADTSLPPLTAARFFTAWQLDAVALLGVLVAAGLYATAMLRVHRAHPRHGWPAARAASFGAGLLVIILATHSSIGVYDMTVFSVHMIQHLMLIMVAPPLLAAGRPLTLLLHSVHNPWHRRVKRAARSRPVTALTCPPVALAVYAATIVGTHLTGLTDQVMQRPWLGQAEHLLYLVSGYLFAVLIVGDEPIRWRLSAPARLLLLAVSMVVDTFVGVVLIQSVHPVAMASHPGWGTDPLADTRTGGAIMWVFGDGLMALLMILVSIGWSRRPEAARRRGHSWLEQARLSTFRALVGSPDADGTGTHPVGTPPAGTAPAEATPAGAAPAGAAPTGSAPAGGPATAHPPARTSAPRTGRRSTDIDEDEASRAAYNAWLARLHAADQTRRR
jgi:putative copper resistance protein D